MSMRAALSAHASLLATQYATHLPDILELQTVFLHDILPALADELDLDAPAQAAARAWLQDTITLFHIARRNQWTRSCAMDAVRKTLVWRLENVPVANQHPSRLDEPVTSRLDEPVTSRLDEPDTDAYTPPPHLLPHPDPAGRPVLVLKLRDLPPRAHRGAVIRALERLRAHLCRLNHERPEGPSSPSSPLTAAPLTQSSLSSTSAPLDGHSTPALQYLLLLDLSSASLPSLDLDLITWTLRDASPKFPGLVAGVLVLNYSWAHAGLWAVAKRLIPEAGSGGRVWFPTTEELVDWFGEANLPEEYGGSLQWPPPTPERSVSPAGSSASASSSRMSISSRSPSPTPTPIPRAISLSPLSILNPFFGYPSRIHSHTPASRAHHPTHPAPANSSVSRAAYTPGRAAYTAGRAAYTPGRARHAHHRHTSHSLPHGRRRRRDLAKTLLWLFWARWGGVIRTIPWTGALLWAARRWKRLLIGLREWERTLSNDHSLRSLSNDHPLRTLSNDHPLRTKQAGKRSRGISQREWDALLGMVFTGFGAGVQGCRALLDREEGV